MNTQQKIIQKIKTSKRFLITAHINPEGDAIASQLALGRVLRCLKKQVYIYNQDPVPENLKFLPGTKQIKNQPPREKPEVSFVLDCPALARTGKAAGFIKDSFIVNIDHHISNTGFGRINWVESMVSSASELIYHLVKELRMAIDCSLALPLYVGIMTDTGSFRFSNTTPQTHKIAAELMGCGISVERVYEEIFLNKSAVQLRLIAGVILNMDSIASGKIIWSKITRRMLQYRGREIEAGEDLIENIRQVKGAEVIALFRELKDKKAIKVSLRSRGRVDVNRVAACFGGGGHRLASGCTIPGTMDRVIKKTIAKIRNFL